jgi:hypothetical protein
VSDAECVASLTSQELGVVVSPGTNSRTCSGIVGITRLATKRYLGTFVPDERAYVVAARRRNLIFAKNTALR